MRPAVQPAGGKGSGRKEPVSGLAARSLGVVDAGAVGIAALCRGYRLYARNSANPPG